MIKYFVFVLFLTAICQATVFSPIETGTFFITAEDLKGLNQKITKEISLQTPWQVFNQNLNINVVCVISSINIDERVSLQFMYKLSDKTDESSSSGKRKILQVSIIDKKGFSYPDLSLGINYLIAQNLRSDNYNMTDFQQHLMNQSLTQQEANPSNKEVHNELFLFPNGFSSFNLTHHVMYNYITPPYDMYTIHYMTGQGEHVRQGWTSKRDFINFRYILYPRYQFGYKSCGAVYETQLEDDFYFNCDKKGTDGYFFGLMGAGGSKFIGNFSMSRTGFSFHVQELSQGHKYNILAIPYKINDKFNFIDNRQHDYNYIEQQNFFVYLIITIIMLLLIVVIVAVIKRKKTVYFDLMEENTNQPAGSSASKEKKSSKKSVKITEEKNSDEEMKEKCPTTNSQVITSGQIQSKNDEFYH